MSSELTLLAEKIGKKLLADKQIITTAESCTGGWVAQTITAIAGSSAWFERGFVTYTNTAKQEMLGVLPSLLETVGAVSEEVAIAMAQGALQHSHADVSLAITGIAGPGGATEHKPVGMVCFAWARRDGSAWAKTQIFSGDRTSVRAQAVAFSLLELL